MGYGKVDTNLQAIPVNGVRRAHETCTRHDLADVSSGGGENEIEATHTAVRWTDGNQPPPVTYLRPGPAAGSMPYSAVKRLGDVSAGWPPVALAHHLRTRLRYGRCVGW
jgi:hypothetical protein